MCENYTDLRKQLLEYTSKNPSPDVKNIPEASKKRKSETSIINNGGIDGKTNIDPSECSSSDDDSSKKLKVENVKPKITRLFKEQMHLIQAL